MRNLCVYLDIYKANIHTQLLEVIMFLKEYNSTALQRNSSEVYEAALIEPVMITRQAKENVILISKAKFEELMKASQAVK